MAVRPSPAATLPYRSRRRRVRTRPVRSRIPSLARWLALIPITLQVSCSGGAGGPAASRVDPLPSVTLSISPGSAQISAGASIQFTVTIQNASNPAVIWQVNDFPGGNSAVGTIASSGPLVASYTAPASVSASLTVTVAAVLQADATKSASATVTVNPLPGPQITISPANTTVVQGMSLQFSAAVQSGPPAVIWEVNNIAGGSASIGTISSSGFYTAPVQIPNPPKVTITALLFSKSSVSASTSLTIVAATPSVSISPTTANVIAGQTLQFSATVQNSKASVTWEVNNTPGGNFANGTINASGTYSAPVNPQSFPLPVTVTAVLQTNPPISASAGVTVISGNTLAGVYSWRNDNSLTGQNSQETKLTPSNVNPSQFGKLFSCPVGGAIFAQPLYVANVAIPSQGTHNVVYVATENDSVYAFDADNLCNVLWHVTFTDPTNAITAVPAADIQGQTDIVPVIGITGTPVIDPNTATLYVVSKTKISQGVTASYDQQLHALDLTTGVERADSPAIVKASVNGVTFDPLYQNQRSALLLAGGNVYIAFDSYADTGTFHGWVFAYDAANLQNTPTVFISTPNGTNGGIGESGAAPSADANGDIFVTTSDGKPFDASTGGDYPESLLNLQITGGSGLGVVDSFTPSDEATLEAQLKSFGTTGVLLLPNSAGGALSLAVAGSEAVSGGGLSPNLYLLNRNSLGGLTSTGLVQSLCITVDGSPAMSASITSTPAYWANSSAPTVYVAGDDDTLKAFPLVNGAFSSPSCSSGAAVPTSRSVDTFPLFGASPVTSSDGAANGIVWALDTSGYVTSSPAILHAYDATNLTRIYVSSSISGAPQAAGAAVKFAVPTVANGKVYVGTQTELSVFGLLQ